MTAAGAALPDGACAARYEKKFAGKAVTGIEDRYAYRFVKRAFDVVFSLLVFVVFSLKCVKISDTMPPGNPLS